MCYSPVWRFRLGPALGPTLGLALGALSHRRNGWYGQMVRVFVFGQMVRVVEKYRCGKVDALGSSIRRPYER